MNWHICAIAYYLEQVRLGKIKRLIITVPPRSLKSIMCSVAFPAFVLGHDPSKRLIVASYSADLAIKHGNDFRTVVNSAEYHGIFPGMRISAMKNTQTEVVTTLNGFRLAMSVDGTLTGRGGDIIIIDDPIAALAALSQKSREHVVDWYFNTLLSRLDDKQNGAIVLVMQRLHEDDLAGVLLRGSDEWTVAEPAGNCGTGRTDSNRQWTNSLPSRRRRAPPGARIKGGSGVAARSARCGDLRGPVSAAACAPRRRHDQARLGPPL